MLRKIKRIISPASVLGSAALIAFIIIMAQTETAIEYMSKGLKLCAASVIPSLFPFMVISELIVRSGIGLRISKIMSRPVKALFGVSEACACAYILGIACGFPIGAATAVSMFDSGIISKRELERTLIFCNNPGSAFVISAVGSALIGSREIGIMLFFCVLLSSCAVGILARAIFGPVHGDGSDAPAAVRELDIDATALTGAIRSSATSMLFVCAFVVFFSVIVGCIGAALSFFGTPKIITTLLFGLFEISSGVKAATELDSRAAAVLLCAAFCAWSGISVHFQVMSVAAGRGVSFKPYLLAKGVQSVICCAMAGIGIKLFFPSIDSMSVPSLNEIGDAYGSLRPCLLFFGASLSPFLINFSLWIKGKIFFAKKLKKIQKKT